MKERNAIKPSNRNEQCANVLEASSNPKIWITAFLLLKFYKPYKCTYSTRINEHFDKFQIPAIVFVYVADSNKDQTFRIIYIYSPNIEIIGFPLSPLSIEKTNISH